MKIITHEFKQDDEIVVNDKGEMEVLTKEPIKASFRFIGRSAYVFEHTYGKSLLGTFGSVANGGDMYELLNCDILNALCKSSYIDMNHPNDADSGAIAYDQTNLAELVIADTTFVTELVESAIEFLKVAPQDHKESVDKSNKQKGKTSKK